jgi:hypothetical protein
MGLGLLTMTTLSRSNRARSFFIATSCMATFGALSFANTNATAQTYKYVPKNFTQTFYTTGGVYTFNRQNSTLTSGQWFEGSMTTRVFDTSRLPNNTAANGVILSGSLAVVNPDGTVQFQSNLGGLTPTWYTNLQNCGQSTNLFEVQVGSGAQRAYLDFNFNYNVLLPGSTGVYTSWNQNGNTYRLTSGCDSLIANILVPRAVPISYTRTIMVRQLVQTTQATAQTRVTQSRFVKFMSSIRRFFGAGDDEDLIAFAPWIDPIGSWARQTDSNGQVPYSTNSGGFAIGIDGDYNEKLFVGGAFTYMRANTSVAALLPTSMQSDNYNVTLYGRYSIAPAWGLTLMAGYGNVQNKSKRAIDFNNTGFATASMSSDVLSGRVGLERDFGMTNDLVITPSISLAGYYLNNGGFTEQNDPNGAIIAGKATNTVTADANLRAMYKINDMFGVMANVGASYDIVQGSVTVSAAPVYSPTSFISISSEQLVPWAFQAGAGLVVNATKQVTLGAQYGVQLRPGYQNNAGTVSLRVAF